MSSLNIDSVTGTSTSMIVKLHELELNLNFSLMQGTDDPDLHMNEIGNNQEISL
eukprot:m.327304 g.327304  ORF g.327304 m.327304 type:complete len:54 (-) comp16565_c0_seq31:1009-1170(-)